MRYDLQGDNALSGGTALHPEARDPAAVPDISGHHDEVQLSGAPHRLSADTQNYYSSAIVLLLFALRLHRVEARSVVSCRSGSARIRTVGK